MIEDIFQEQKVPQCCKNCQYLDYDCDDYRILFYYCEKNIYLPTKKQSCKKQLKKGELTK